MNETVKGTLLRQLRMVSKKSKETESAAELAMLTEQMVSLVEALAHLEKVE